MELKIDGRIQVGVSSSELVDVAGSIWKLLDGKNVKEIKEIIAILEYYTNEKCVALTL